MSEDPLRSHLVELLRGGSAYDTFEDVLAEFSEQERGVIPSGAEHSPWQILDHMHRALRDIVEFADNEDGSYQERNWPGDYWALEPAGDWEQAAREYLRAREQMERLVTDEGRDLYRVFPWGNGQTLLREALLAADHQSYHLGELVELKRWLVASS